MTDGSIKDWQLAASSALSRADDPQCAVKFARLHQGIAIACINFRMFFQKSPFCFGSLTQCVRCSLEFSSKDSGKG